MVRLTMKSLAFAVLAVSLAAVAACTERSTEPKNELSLKTPSVVGARRDIYQVCAYVDGALMSCWYQGSECSGTSCTINCALYAANACDFGNGPGWPPTGANCVYNCPPESTVYPLLVTPEQTWPSGAPPGTRGPHVGTITASCETNNSCAQVDSAAALACAGESAGMNLCVPGSIELPKVPPFLMAWEVEPHLFMVNCPSGIHKWDNTGNFMGEPASFKVGMKSDQGMGMSQNSLTGHLERSYAFRIVEQSSGRIFRGLMEIDCVTGAGLGMSAEFVRVL